MRFEKQLVKLLENKAILKIGADVAGDIRSLLALRRFRPGGFVDLQQLAPTGASKRRACASFRPSCWASAKRESPAAEQLGSSAAYRKQMRYAATDAWICPRNLPHAATYP